MNKKISLLAQSVISSCLALALVSASHAEIYKWVDASGRTHYSENKDEAGKAKAEETKIKSTSMPASASANTSSTPRWREQDEEFKQRQAQKQNEARHRPPAPTGPRSTPDANQPETDASRCALARGISSGQLVRSNGIKTDANDRLIAERDISTYCR